MQRDSEGSGRLPQTCLRDPYGQLMSFPLIPTRKPDHNLHFTHSHAHTYIILDFSNHIHSPTELVSSWNLSPKQEHKCLDYTRHICLETHNDRINLNRAITTTQPCTHTHTHTLHHSFPEAAPPLSLSTITSPPVRMNIDLSPASLTIIVGQLGSTEKCFSPI